MKSLQVVAFLIIICCDQLIGIPFWDSNNLRNLSDRFSSDKSSRSSKQLSKTSSPPNRSPTQSNTVTDPVKRVATNRLPNRSSTFIDGAKRPVKLENFKPDRELSDETFILAKPMKFEAKINRIAAMADRYPLHSGWLKFIIQMAEMNKEFAKSLSFPILPMNKITVNRLQDALKNRTIEADENVLMQLEKDFKKYDVMVDEMRKHFRIMVEINLFEQFSLTKLHELVKFEMTPPNRMNMMSLCEREINETKEIFQKFILEHADVFKKHFLNIWPKFEFIRRPQKFLRDLETFFDLCVNPTVERDLHNLEMVLEKVHDRQENFINKLLDIKRIVETPNLQE